MPDVDLGTLEDYWKQLQRTSSFVAGEVDVGDTEVELRVGAAALSGRIRLRVKALASNDDVVYIIETGGGTSSGYPLLPGEELPQPFEFGAASAVHVFAIAGSGTQKVRIIEEA